MRARWHMSFAVSTATLWPALVAFDVLSASSMATRRAATAVALEGSSTSCLTLEALGVSGARSDSAAFLPLRGELEAGALACCPTGRVEALVLRPPLGGVKILVVCVAFSSMPPLPLGGSPLEFAGMAVRFPSSNRAVC